MISGQILFHRIGPQRLLGIGVGLSLALAYWSWTTWGQLTIIAAGICLIPLCALIILYPIIGAVIVAFLVTALPTLMMPQVPSIILAITLVALLVRKFFAGELTWRVTPFVVWSSLLLVWFVISIIWVDSYDQIGFATNYYGFLIALVFVEVVKTRTEWKYVGYAAALGIMATGLVMAYGFYELVSTGMIFKAADLTGGGKGMRFYGLWNSPNALAYSMLAFVALSISFLSQNMRRSVRIFLISASITGLTVIVLTLSRGAWLCTALMFFLAAKYFQKPLRVISAMAIFILAASFFLPVDVIDRVHTMVQGKRDASFGERGIMLRSGIQMIEDSFPIGYGAGGTIRYSTDYATHLMSPLGTHNSYLDLFAEGGIIAGLLFLGMSISLFNAVRRSAYPLLSQGDGFTRGMLFSGLIAVLIGMAFENVIGFPAYWLYFTLLSIYPVIFSQAPTT